MADIKIENLNHLFDNGTRAVADASFSVSAREFVSIVGPSGCGKTTILNLLAGLLPVQPGSTMLLADQAPRPGRRDVAYMLARDCLFPWRTALENALVGSEFRNVDPKYAIQRANHFLEQVGLKQFTSAYPKALSHGMRQRVALARTFTLESQFLLMDEPFGALDAQTKLQLEGTLMDLWDEERRTVVFITHDLSEAITLSDRVIVMSARPGRIVADIEIPLPRPRSVRNLQSEPLYHELYRTIWQYLASAAEESNENRGDK